MRKPKFKIGDRVRCTRKSHYGKKTFIIADYLVGDKFDPFVYYYSAEPCPSQHISGETFIGCREGWLRRAPRLKMRRKK